MDYEVNDEFIINNDNIADWAVRTIKAEEEETNRLIAIAEDQIDKLNQKIHDLSAACEHKTGFLRSKLVEYFNTVPHKETKTQESYKLLSGTLVYKKPSQKIIHDDKALIEALEGTKYVEVKKSLKWGDYKMNLSIEDGKVLDLETGEIIKACTVEDVPASFNIKF